MTDGGRIRFPALPVVEPTAAALFGEELRRRHDSASRTVVEEGLGSGELTVTSLDPVLMLVGVLPGATTG
jgi:hypothetical protein